MYGKYEIGCKSRGKTGRGEIKKWARLRFSSLHRELEGAKNGGKKEEEEEVQRGGEVWPLKNAMHFESRKGLGSAV